MLSPNCGYVGAIRHVERRLFGLQVAGAVFIFWRKSNAVLLSAAKQMDHLLNFVTFEENF
jgi:hypothetical protein